MEKRHLIIISIIFLAIFFSFIRNDINSNVVHETNFKKVPYQTLSQNDEINEEFQDDKSDLQNTIKEENSQEELYITINNEINSMKSNVIEPSPQKKSENEIGFLKEEESKIKTI